MQRSPAGIRRGENMPSTKALFINWAIFGILLDGIANGKGSDPLIISQKAYSMTKSVLENGDRV